MSGHELIDALKQYSHKTKVRLVVRQEYPLPQPCDESLYEWRIVKEIEIGGTWEFIHFLEGKSE